MFESEGKYLTRSRAVVKDNKDPNKRGRIRVNHPLLGETVWINYLKIPGVFDVPKIGDIVYIEADCGHETHPIAWGNIVKGNDGDLDLPEAFQRISPTNRGMYSPGGHLFEIDDGIVGPTLQNKGVRLTTSSGIKLHFSDNDDLITLANSAGSILTFSEEQIDIQNNNTSININAEGDVNIFTPESTSTYFSNGDIRFQGPKVTLEMTADGSITLSNDNANISINDNGFIEITSGTSTLTLTEDGKVELAGGTDAVVAIMSEIADALSTTTAAGFGAPISSVATFATIKARIDAIKAP